MLMDELVQRIGIPVFIQMIIEAWNSVFLLIMIFSFIIGKHIDELNSDRVKRKISILDEIIIFYVLIFLYNMIDVFCISAKGDTSVKGYYISRISEFCYWLTGAFQTLFFLQLVKELVAKKNGLKKLENMTLVFQLIFIPNLIILAVTPFANTLYYFDEKNIYHRGPLYEIWNITTIAAFMYILVVLIVYRKKLAAFLRHVIVFAAVIPLISFVFNIVYTGISFNNISVSLLALVIYMLYEKHRAAMSVQDILELEKVRTQLTESKLAVERNKNELLMAQIQPHFINNSLMALRSRCSDYPEIYESITNFSRYLRSNFDALGDTRLITFEQEMENIEAYLALEKQNFGDRLSVEYDIELDDFMIPALTVQPLVENAVRHGVGTYDKGGTVRISAKRANGNIVIEIIDDGSGVNSITDQQKNRKGIGIENVRARLGSMRNGNLDIISNEHGTTARITLSDAADIGDA